MDYCRFGTLFCVSPRVGPAAGGTRVRLSANHFGCVFEGIVQVDCSFAGTTSPATYNSTTNTLDCLSPPGTAGATVVFDVVDRATGHTIWPAESVDQPPMASLTVNVTFPSAKLLFSFLPDAEFAALAEDPHSDRKLCEVQRGRAVCLWCGGSRAARIKQKSCLLCVSPPSPPLVRTAPT